MNTTATHRALARQYAADLQWHAAAYHMRRAIALYPAEDRPGSLAALDLEKMRRWAEEWERQAESEGLPVFIGEWDSDGRTLIDPEF